MSQISILGCGWLGLPLAKSLLKKGYSIQGSTTSIEKISVLKSEGIIPFIVSLSAVEVSDETKTSIELFLNNSEILIIDIPPKLRGDSKENFVGKIQTLVPFIEKSSIKKVLFISSTSVYSDENLTITEKFKPNPDSESGRQLLAAEKILQSNSYFKTTVVRFGGLIGDDRHPIKFLAGKKNIENPNAPINMIHQEDCIGIIEAILRQAQNDNLEWNETFNAVAPFHPSRKEYYTQKGIDFGLPLPEFDEKKPSVGKLILSTKIEEVLGYTFKKELL